MTDNPNYKITFMLDSAAMITVHTPKRGVVEVTYYTDFGSSKTSWHNMTLLLSDIDKTKISKYRCSSVITQTESIICENYNYIFLLNYGICRTSILAF